MKHNHIFHFKGGYKVVQWMQLTTNICVASVLLIISTPLFIILPILIKMSDKGPVFYSGLRLGKNKNLFYMYKFRTLIPEAEDIIGSDLVSTSQLKLVTPLGKFLRETRIDELPQLINILKGDMTLIGPRPERPAVYEVLCSQIPWYDKRFLVKPGVFGYSQLFTPHSASKKTRSLIDNFYIDKEYEIFSSIKLIVYALFILFIKIIHNVFKLLASYFKRTILGQKLKEYRASERIKRKNIIIRIWYRVIDDDYKSVKMRIAVPDISGRVVDINDTSIYIEIPNPLKDEPIHIELIKSYKSFFFFKARHKSVYSNAQYKLERLPKNAKEGKYYYVISIQSLSPLNQLKLHKYFLYKSIS